MRVRVVDHSMEKPEPETDYEVDLWLGRVLQIHDSVSRRTGRPVITLTVHDDHLRLDINMWPNEE